MSQGPTYAELTDMHRYMCRVAGEQGMEIDRLRAVVYRLSEDVAFSPMNSSDMDELKARLKYARENLHPFSQNRPQP